MKKFISLVLKVLGWYDIRPIVKRGSTRMAIIFAEQGFVIKVPIVSPLKALVKIWEYRYHPKMCLILFKWDETVPGSIKYWLFKGIADNWREYLFYQTHRRWRFLFPTNFSFLGLFNITPIGEEIPDNLRLWASLPTSAHLALRLDGHHFTKNENFCHYEGCIRIRDYGSRNTQKIIRRHFEVLNTLPSLNELAEW